jgi:peptide methionine sulfoxide reductase MsrB|eukprot:COSAG06_NODE_11817_length_1460_cov_30.436444_1_plen_272_part_00
MPNGSKVRSDAIAVTQNLQMAGGLLSFVGCVCLVFSFMGGGGGECIRPVAKDIRWGTADDWDMAEHICCHNTQFAEPSGYFARENLFSQLRQEKTGSTVTFYDSVCGLPLFEAPIGRSMAALEQESIAHGWPSFRPAEMIAENVIIHTGGRMSSVCGTHLGHNLPDYTGDRYCIDLVCIAGHPAEAGGSNGSSVAPELAGAGERPFSWSSTDTAYLCFGLAVLSCALSHSSAAARIAACADRRRQRRASAAGASGAGVGSIKEDLEPGVRQ